MGLIFDPFEVQISYPGFPSFPQKRPSQFVQDWKVSKLGVLGNWNKLVTPKTLIGTMTTLVYSVFSGSWWDWPLFIHLLKGRIACSAIGNSYSFTPFFYILMSLKLHLMYRYSFNGLKISTIYVLPTEDIFPSLLFALWFHSWIFLLYKMVSFHVVNT